MGKKRIEVVVPHLAESVVEATIAKWLKQPGDQIEAYEPLCEVITEKVTAEIPSTADGVLLEIHAEEGETVDVGALICVIEGELEEGETPPEPKVKDDAADVEAAEDQSMRRRLSPAVRRLAEDHHVDLDEVKGTGIQGRITRKDVLNYVDNRPIRSKESMSMQKADKPQTSERELSSNAVEAESPNQLKAAVASGRDDLYVDVTPIRNQIASKMRQSVTEIPHAWTMIEVDVTNLVRARNRMKDEFKRQEGVNLTYLAFVLKAVVNAVKDYPMLNSVWAVDKIIVKHDINISLPVGTEDSVIAPVIKKADQKNIAGLAQEIDELSRKARAGQLRLDEIQSGTISVNNTGSFGSILSYPIINYPQAANLTFESIVKRPVVIDDMIAVRSMVNMCLSLDHRILDGVICGRFMQRVKENLEGFGPDTKLY